MKNRLTSNKGFSLVELIIVIAIMAVLFGILTPFYVRFIRKSKIAVDIANADEMAHAIIVAFADLPDSVINGTPAAGAVITYAADTAIITDAAGNVIVAAPASEVQSDYQWFVSYNAEGTGLAEIRLGATSSTATEIWPSTSAYEAANR
ncbi:MAG: prepilin-type N-terminal cleavage/methylation domain-containing protein [Acetatifactor sp.]|nr:prepilin-type N-terminal cleavage/methylation domain-containing protein [Acetatifactor sp.]